MPAVTPKALLATRSSWNEEKSFDFLQFIYSYQNWYSYTTKELDKETVLRLTDIFSLSHGKIIHPEHSSLDFWSIEPINVFRYRMTADQYFEKIRYANPKYNVDGYIVEGAYWSNGFYYQVIDDNISLDNYVNEIHELNLFIDKATFQIQNYPDYYAMSTDLISKFYKLPS